MYYAIVILNVFVASLAQMLLKKGASSRHGTLLGEYLNLWVAGGYLLLALTLVVNIFAMSRGVLVKEVSTIESLSYLFVPVLSFFCFREKLTLRKTISVALIIIGIIIFFWQ